MFIVLEKFNRLDGIINVVCDEDGLTLFFEREEEAQKEADDCQDGQVVDIAD